MAGAEMRLPAAVTVTVSCRTSRDTTKGSKRHPVTLNPDGTIDTPHDLEQERILAALGGYLSCLELVDSAGPAFRHWYALQMRLVPRPIRARRPDGPWDSSKRAQCCPRKGFPTPQAAAQHVREARHVALINGAHARQLAELVRGAQIMAPVPESEPWATLWECGMHPDEVDRIRGETGLDLLPEPEFYLAVMSVNPDLAWLAQTVRAVPLPPPAMAWLAWSYGKYDRDDLTARARWLATGIMDRLVVPMMKSAYETHDVEQFADYWRMSFLSAALHLLQWQDAGVAPAVADLTGHSWDHLAYPPPPPRWESRIRVRDALDRPDDFTESEIARALLLAGTAGRAVRMLEWGLSE